MEDIIDDLAFTQNIVDQKLKNILKKYILWTPQVLELELFKCLSIQLARKEKERPEVELTRKIIDTAFDEFSRKHYKNFKIDSIYQKEN